MQHHEEVSCAERAFGSRSCTWSNGSHDWARGWEGMLMRVRGIIEIVVYRCQQMRWRHTLLSPLSPHGMQDALYPI